MMKTASTLMIYLLWICTMSGCQREELIEEPPSSFATMRIQIDWSKAKIQPKGATILFYPVDDGKGKREQLLTNQVTDDVMKVKEGVYDVIVFNQAPGDFGTFDIVGLDKESTLAIQMKSIKSDWYSSGGSEKVIEEPEVFAVARMQNVIINQQMTNESNKEGKEFPLQFTPERVIKQTTLSIKLKGIKNIKEARGALIGMADNYLIASGKTGSSEATLVFTLDKITKDKDNSANGSISGTFSILGIPTAETKTGGVTKELKVSFLLVDNKTVIQHTYQITEKMLHASTSGSNDGSDGSGSSGSEETDSNIQIELGTPSTDPDNPDNPDNDPVELPDVKPEGGGSSSGGGGFDADIGDWGEGEDTIFPV